jgi:uncharacterized protein (TIGR02646 family)
VIKLDRSGVTPTTGWLDKIKQKFPNWTAFQSKAKEFEALHVDSDERRKGIAKFAPEVFPARRDGAAKFPDGWGSAKRKLAKMTHRKCAYCESKIHRLRLGQVEHFHPKNLFPAAAYDWNNYFLACGGCNGAKSNKWPKGGTYLRPDQDDGTVHFTFAADGKVKARDAGPGGDAARHTICDWALDEEWQRDARKFLIDFMLDAMKPYEAQPGIPQNVIKRSWKGALKRVSDPKTTYSAALTECLLRKWDAAHPGDPLT